MIFLLKIGSRELNYAATGDLKNGETDAASIIVLHFEFHFSPKLNLAYPVQSDNKIIVPESAPWVFFLFFVLFCFVLFCFVFVFVFCFCFVFCLFVFCFVFCLFVFCFVLFCSAFFCFCLFVCLFFNSYHPWCRPELLYTFTPFPFPICHVCISFKHTNFTWFYRQGVTKNTNKQNQIKSADLVLFSFYCVTLRYTKQVVMNTDCKIAVLSAVSCLRYILCYPRIFHWWRLAVFSNL